MKQPVILAVLAATWIGVAPAQAQHVAADLLPSYEVATIVASMGMRPLDRPIWRHGRYTVTAIDRYGREVRVVLDARDGQVIAVRPLPRDYVYEPRYAPPPPAYPHSGPYDPRYEAPPSPPGRVPGGPGIDDDEFYDDDRLEGSLRSPSMPRTAPVPRDVVTGSVPPRTTSLATSKSSVERRDGSNRNVSPLPRPRPALANAKPENPKDGDLKSDVSKTTGSIGPAVGQAASDKKSSDNPAAKPDLKAASGAKPVQENGAKADAPKSEVRVIDLSKPKSEEKREEKPGEAIRF